MYQMQCLSESKPLHHSKIFEYFLEKRLISMIEMLTKSDRICRSFIRTPIFSKIVINKIFLTFSKFRDFEENLSYRNQVTYGNIQSNMVQNAI